jgi:hypothetical protein
MWNPAVVFGQIALKMLHLSCGVLFRVNHLAPNL